MTNKPPIVKILEILRENDPTFHEVLTNTLKGIDGDALDEKTRVLIKLVIASIFGKDEGVKIHAKEARELGATTQEIAEVVRLVFIGAGVPGLYSAIHALEH